MDRKSLYMKNTGDLFTRDLIDGWIEKSRQIDFKRGEIISKDQLGDYVYLVASGTVNISHMHEDGKECIIGLVDQGEFIELYDAFSPQASPIYARALSPVRLALVKKEDIRRAVEEDGQLALKLLASFSEKIQDMVEILSQVAYGKVEERLIFLLEKISQEEGQEGWYPIQVQLTHQDLAGMVASSRETVTLLINKLIKEGRLKNQEGLLWIRKM